MATCTVCQIHAESTFKVQGMDCSDEVALIERRFKSLSGLEGFTADVVGQRLHVTYDAAKLSTSAIVDAVADAGMRIWLEDEVASHEHAPTLWRAVLLGGAAVAFGMGLAASTLLGLPEAATAAYAVSLAFGIPLTAPKALQALRLGVLDINVLMLVAAAGAIALGQWSEGAAVVGLFAVAQSLELRTLERARHAVSSLLELAPAMALIEDGAGRRSVPAASVQPGTTIVIRPGDRIALDGVVLRGATTINQAPITGESMPVEKTVGDDVFAGSINGSGALELRVTHLRRDTRLARIAHMVERAQSVRAPSQTFIERFARVYTPAVLVLAAFVALLPPLAAGGDWSTWIYRALVLLVVSCPCALVISTPVSVVAALTAAARHGVLIKGGAHLERAASLRALAFDKTGTLTLGEPTVIAVHGFADVSIDVVMATASAVEQRSEHPIGAAILRHAAHLGIDALPAQRVRALAGLGASGDVDGESVLVGNRRLFDDRRIPLGAQARLLAALAESGETPVIVARNDIVIGVIAIADRPRPSAKLVVAALRAQGYAIALLTGDTVATARAIGASVGVSETYGELMPEEKVARLADLKQRYGPVAMVGDGINDAPALAFADVGIAMGAAGSAAAIESADIALMSDDLTRLPYALRLSRAALRNIKANLAVSLVLKAAFVVAAVAGVATLWLAVLADTGASVLVIANALRLLRAEPGGSPASRAARSSTHPPAR